LLVALWVKPVHIVETVPVELLPVPDSTLVAPTGLNPVAGCAVRVLAPEQAQRHSTDHRRPGEKSKEYDLAQSSLEPSIKQSSVSLNHL